MLHDRIIIATIKTAFTPTVPTSERMSVTETQVGATRVVIHYGFMQTPDVPAALAMLAQPPKPAETTYFLSRQTIIAGARPGMMRWREVLFAALVRASETPMTAFRLPTNRVVELGSQVEI